jgi:amino-acid N-acetyltransferase
MEEIRYAKMDDLEKIFEIMESEARSVYTIDLVRDMISSEGSLSLIVTEDEKIAGMIGARAEGKNSAWIYYVLIGQDFRGKGYAKKLMEKFFDEARSKGIKRVATDTPNSSFFEKFGFSEAGRIPHWYEEKDQIILFREI